MKAILIALLLVPFIASAQVAPIIPDVNARKHNAPELFAEAGYAHDLWTITNKLSYGYSAMSYTGNGGYLGGGFRSVINPGHHVGYGLSLDFLQYQMGKKLATDQRAAINYSFLKVSPMVYLNFTPKKCKFNFQLCGIISLMAPVKANEYAYLQYGGKACIGYKAYEANIGLGLGQGNKGPGTDIQSKWREQMFTLGVACYLGRIPIIKQYAKVKSKKTKAKTKL